MSNCKCEHWQQCPVCMPHRFDKNGHLLPPEPTPLQAARLQVADLERQRDTFVSHGHRLALELQCLLLDTKDLPTVSRWWSTGMDALTQWQNLFPYDGPRLGD